MVQLTVTILNEEAEFVVDKTEEDSKARRTADEEASSEENKTAERVTVVYFEGSLEDVQNSLNA